MKLRLREFAHRVRILDGAWGTELQRRGLPAVPNVISLVVSAIYDRPHARDPYHVLERLA